MLIICKSIADSQFFSNNSFTYFWEELSRGEVLDPQLITHLLKMSKYELSLKVLQIANFSQITHSPTFGRAFTW